MAIKSFKPVTPGRRNMTVASFSEVTKSKPEKSLTCFIKNRAGRDSNGTISVRHRGGGHKRLYRMIDFKHDKLRVKGKVMSVEYDPYRSAYIMMVSYTDGEKRYHLAPNDIKVGDVVVSAPKTSINTGNRLQIGNVPPGFNIFNIELNPGCGGKLVRSAGTCAQVVSTDSGKYVQVKFPSGEIRLINKECYATIGTVGNLDHNNITIGKAGRSRWMRRRPEVRGKVMNPCDHPHGGGEGSNSIGLKYPKTPWGKHALGVKTRKRKHSDRMMIQKRK
ncbi:MAG: 50S ribosomal protein L2, large subunit ribosomal protein L2 [Candidatus Peregrinibacteria bacterium GW2011_GWF2_33_10]|nr:MAG: 50S ribosomal protein L2, large subunit ribosomal protein L2 [Candidatus Peregrinibacteria bacterium GW2011_GWF2_33_10]OGJ46134.1 MAG: 50S ribosomal protein L2 [Candidatus Peregrinibacteria bacterium RIFOXYA12_FULL_33_12]OGJ46160.1 MAG: 50S ribosomal protein L2 [Candidatus Peregrinibacteria bacterium RIFOXYA2_FULL_33_21]OGJ51577.1 MAG: 50S ribosomal protein L2 [Candidatus Peregrinibacteria bacterium RIFOXYB2_FULL_33_20]